MKKFITLTLAVLCLALQNMSAQKRSEGTDNYKYYKAIEMLQEDDDPAEARRLVMENIEANPKHIDSYMLLAAIDRNEENYASALHVLNNVEKVNYKGSGMPESKILWLRASVYGDMEEYGRAVAIMEEALKNGYLSDSDVKGKKNYMTASGDIHEGTVLRLKVVKLGDAVLKNVEASVVHSQKAPLLLGQSVLEKFGTITIDNVNSKLLIKQ